MKKVLIIGAGVSGKGVLELLKALGHEADLVDDATNCPPDIKSDFWQKCDIAITSPGVTPESCWLKSALNANLHILSESEFVLSKLSAWGCTLLGITGTNGKTTMTLFIAWALKQKGLQAIACGNVGYSLGKWASDLIKGPLARASHLAEDELAGALKGHIGILELSSFQLEHLESRVLDGGAILNFSCDHLDRHKTLENYAASKGRLTFCMKPGKKAYVPRSFASDYPKAVNEVECIDTPLQEVDGIDRIDLMNLKFAHLLLKPFGFTFSEVIDLYKKFPKPKHRRSFVCEIQGVRYINDSKATNLAAVAAAFEAEKGDIWLITSGQMKQESFKDLSIDKKRLKGVIAFGESQQDAFEAFHPQTLVLKARTLNEAVALAAQNAKSGQTVLLSPGGASFDLFENYIDRGEQFEYAVNRSRSLEGASYE